MVLSRIRLENFRYVIAANLDLAPLTILYGENGAGKSSIIEALQLLKQSAGHHIHLAGTDFHDPNRRIVGLDFGEYYDIVRNNIERNWITIEVETEPTRGELDEINNIIDRKSVV